jgi:uncharacterized protein (TIGR02598 family)
MKANQPSRFRRLSNTGFSLIEVVLAVGIMALGVVTILGLLPHGMEVSRKTANELAEGRIVDTVVGDLQAMTWEKVQDAAGSQNGPYGGTAVHFDDQGLRINRDQALTEQSYIARVKVPQLDSSNPKETGAVILPTNDPAQPYHRNLRRVIIEVASTPLVDFNFDEPPTGVPVRRYAHVIANMR